MDYPKATVEVGCEICGRKGKYSKERFIELVGGDTELPTALGMIAKDCPKANQSAHFTFDRCRARA